MDGLELPFERKIGNLYDPSAVAVMKRSPDTSVIVSHVPILISTVGSILICQDDLLCML